MGRRVVVAHRLLETNMRFIHGDHGGIHRLVIGRVHAQKFHVVGPRFVVVGQRFLSRGQSNRHAHVFQSVGRAGPGCSGCGSAGTGPKSGSTGKSVGVGTGFSPGDSGGSSSDRVERMADVMAQNDTSSASSGTPALTSAAAAATLTDTTEQ